MTAKQYLRQGTKLKELIETHKEELAQLRSLVGSVSAPALDKQGGGQRRSNGSAEQDLIIRSVDLERQITEEIAQMVAMLQEIHDTIEAVPDRSERLVLRCRYILFLSWTETAEKANYSSQQVRRIHGSALQHITVPEKYRDPAHRKDEQV